MAVVDEILKASGWAQLDWKSGAPIADINFSRDGLPIAGLSNITVVIIQMHATEIARLGPAAKVLADALTSEGINAKAEFGFGGKNVNTNALHVLIGRKPIQ